LYLYLNAKSSSEQVSMASTFEAIKAKFNILKPEFARLKDQAVKDAEEKIELNKYNFVESILSSPEKLREYNKQLTKWFDNYNSWSYRGDLKVASPEKQQYLVEFVKKGKPRLSNYMIRLINRTRKYDDRIVTKEDHETVIDYGRREAAEEEQRKQKEDLEKLISRKSPTLKDDREAYDAAVRKARNAANVPIEKRMEIQVPLESIEGTGFGVYPPYLVSDILRYGSSFLKLNVIDALCLTSKNIQQFSEYINGFKSLVFNIASLYHQLALHKDMNICDGFTSDHADLIVNFSYSVSLYPELSWLKFTSESADKLKIEDIEKPVAAPSSSREIAVPVKTSSALTVPTGAESKSEYEIPKKISHWIRFKPCDTAKNSIGILASEPTDLAKTAPLILLPVDEPLYGDDQFDRIKDFDLLYASLFKPKGLFGSFSGWFESSLESNFRDFVDKRYDYHEDLDKSTPVQETTSFELDDMDLFPYLTKEQPSNTIKLLTDIPLVSESSESPTPAKSASIWAKLDKAKMVSTPDPKPDPKPVVEPIKSRKERKIEVEYNEDFDVIPVILSKSSSQFIPNSSIPRSDDTFTRTETTTSSKVFNDRGKESQTKFKERKDINEERSRLYDLGYMSIEDQQEKFKEAKINGLVKRVMNDWPKKYKGLLRHGTFDDAIIYDIISGLYINNLAQFNKLSFDKLQELIVTKAKSIPKSDHTDIKESDGEVFKFMEKDLNDWRKPYEEAASEAAVIRNGLAKSREKSKSKDKDSDKGSGKGSGKGKDDWKHTGGYYEKYLKYKSKYLELKNKLNL
jgi:hypothetical protein